MFFQYDKDVNAIYYRSILRLETTSQSEVVKFFSYLEYPKHWHRYSEAIKDSILNVVVTRLVDNGIVKLVKNKDEHFLRSLLHDDNIFQPKFKL